ncbi:MAG: hypothetical protein H6Q67_1625 [Firmicutes bacterium]|nr:hypothetical protein [Bacillota bacterium]
MKNVLLYDDLITADIKADQLAQLLDLTERRLRQLASDEVIKTYKRGTYKLVDALQGYINFLKGSVNMRGIATKVAKDVKSGNMPSEGTNLAVERTGLTRAQRMKAELDLKTQMGELHRREDVEAVMGDMLGAFRARIMAIPTTLAPRMVAQTEIPVIQSMIKKQLWDALQELSEYDPESFEATRKGSVKTGG